MTARKGERVQEAMMLAVKLADQALSFMKTARKLSNVLDKLRALDAIDPSFLNQDCNSREKKLTLRLASRMEKLNEQFNTGKPILESIIASVFKLSGEVSLLEVLRSLGFHTSSGRR